LLILTGLMGVGLLAIVLLRAVVIWGLIYANENPNFSSHSSKTSATITTASHNSDGTICSNSTVVVPSKEITFRDKPNISETNISVYYPEGYQSLAEEALRKLVAGERVIECIIGDFRSIKEAAVLCGPMKRYEYTPSVAGDGDESPFPVSMIIEKEGEKPRLEESWCPIAVHERVEGLVINMPKPLLYVNSYTRWVGDGLAEYVAQWGLRYICPIDCLDRLRELRERLNKLPMQTYNLHLWQTESSSFSGWLGQLLFPGEYTRSLWELKKAGEDARYYRNDVGYAIAFAFWLDLANQHGETFIKPVLAELSKKTTVTNQDICDLIEKHTGKSVRDTCRAFLVEHAKHVIDEAIVTIEKDRKKG